MHHRAAKSYQDVVPVVIFQVTEKLIKYFSNRLIFDKGYTVQKVILYIHVLDVVIDFITRNITHVLKHIQTRMTKWIL